MHARGRVYVFTDIYFFQIVNDGLFKWPLTQSVKYQSKMGKANVYVSLFAYQGTFSWIFKSDPHVYDNIHGDPN